MTYYIWEKAHCRLLHLSHSEVHSTVVWMKGSRTLDMHVLRASSQAAARCLGGVLGSVSHWGQVYSSGVVRCSVPGAGKTPNHNVTTSCFEVGVDISGSSWVPNTPSWNYRAGFWTGFEVLMEYRLLSEFLPFRRDHTEGDFVCFFAQIVVIFFP